MSDLKPTPQEIERARKIAHEHEVMWCGCPDGPDHTFACDEQTNEIAQALADARERAAVIADGFKTHKIASVFLGDEATPAKLATEFTKYTAAQIAQAIRKGDL